MNINQHQSTPINTNQHHPHCSHSPLSNKGGGGAVIGFHHDVASGGILQQDLHDRHLAHFTGNVQRCLDEKGAFRHVRTRFHQQLGAPGFSLFASNEQGCLARFAGKRRKRRGRRGRRGRRKKRNKRSAEINFYFRDTRCNTGNSCFFLFSKTFFVLQNIPPTTVRVLLTWQNPNHISIGRSAEQMYVGHRRGGLHWNCRGGTAPATIR